MGGVVLRLGVSAGVWTAPTIRRGLAAAALLSVLLALTMQAGARAVDAPPPPRDPSNPYADDKLVPREMMRQYRERQRREAERGSDAAKAERRASRSKYKDKSRSEALAIARAKFERLLEAPAWTGVDLEPGQKVKQYLGDFQALIDAGDEPGDTALVESTLPLRNARGQPTDLALEPSGDGFAPKAPAVEVTLPADVADGVELAGGRLSVAPLTDAATEAVETADKAFYANALTDTDVLVTPTARGFETFHQLRSAESPEQLLFDVRVPGGATLRFGEPQGGPAPGDRGIEVVSPGGKVIARISPPVAYDADGEPVEVDYSIDGMRVTMTVPHRERDVAYPIMVDPDVQAEEWSWAGGNRDTHNWVYASAGGCSGWNRFFGQGFWTYGHVLYGANENQSCGNEEWAEWHWQSPGMSYIYRAEFLNQNHPFRNDCIVNALWNPWAANWDGGWVWLACENLWNHSRGHCPASNNCDMNNGAPSNVAVWKVQNGWWGGWRRYGPWAELGGAAVYVRDRDNPVIDATNHSPTESRWHRSGTLTAAPRAHDDGLGMNKFQMVVPGFQDEYRRHPCLRTRCPGSWSLPNDGQGIFSYNIASIPNGINTVTLNARDALDKITGTSWSINVDDEQPYLNVYGELRDAVYESTWSGARTLSIASHDNITPYDGSHATARSGVTAVDIYVDGLRVHSQTQSCFANCRLDFDWTMYAGDYSAGAHDIRVVARDGAGNERSSSTWKVYTLPSGLATEEKDPEPDDGSSPAITGASLGVKRNCVESETVYCGSSDGTNPPHNEAAAETSLSTPDAFGNPTTSPQARDRWGYAGIRGDEFDRPFVRKLFERPGPKRTRVIVPWDILLRADGVQKYPGTTNPERVPPTYGWYAGSIGGTKTWDERTLRRVNRNPLIQYDRFMERASHYGWEVMISFGSTDEVITYRGDTKYKLGPRVLPRTYDPSNATDPYGYLANVTRILERWRAMYPNLRIQHLSAWNEPNHDAYSPSGRLSFPHLGDASKPKYITQDQMRAGAKYAAAYYNELDNYCAKTSSCQVVAGEFVDRKDVTRYFPHYVEFLNRRPPRWAFHPYLAGPRQIRGYQNWDGVFKWFHSETKNAEGAPHPQIWFTEVGPLYSGSSGNNNNWGTGVDQLVAQMELTLNPRVTRFYYYSAYGGYELKGNPPRNDMHDSGFSDPSRDQRNADGTWKYPYEADRIRPAWCTYGRKTNPDVFSQSLPRWDGGDRGDGTIDGWPGCG
jgi:hypothetical protein